MTSFTGSDVRIQPESDNDHCDYCLPNQEDCRETFDIIMLSFELDLDIISHDLYLPPPLMWGVKIGVMRNISHTFSELGNLPK